MEQSNITKDGLNSPEEKNRRIVSIFSAEAIELGLSILELFYWKALEENEKNPSESPFINPNHPLRQVVEKVLKFNLEEDGGLSDTALYKKLTQPMEVFFCCDRLVEGDMPPEELAPGKFISLYNDDPNGKIRATINIFGPVRKVTDSDYEDSAGSYAKKKDHASKTNEILTYPGVLRLKVIYGNGPFDYFVVRFQALNNRLLFALCHDGLNASQNIISLPRTKPSDPQYNAYVNKYYDSLIGLSGEARNIPFINEGILSEEFKSF